MRSNLATLIDDWRRADSQTAIMNYRGNRAFKTTYAELVSLTERIVSELARREIARGERVILWGENSAEWIASFFACIVRGILVIPLDAAGAADFTSRVLADTSPRLIIGDADLLAKLHATEEAALAQLHLEELASSLPATSTPIDVCGLDLDRQTPLQILFTSGTTSVPKGIVHTHGNVLSSVEPIEREIRRYRHAERFFHPLRFLHTLPLSHVFGQFMGLWLPPLIAAEVHFETRIEAERIVHTIRSRRISVLAAVPRVLDLLRSYLSSRDPHLTSQIAFAQRHSIGWRLWHFRAVHRLLGWKFWAFVCGGAKLPLDLEHFWNSLGYAVVQGYGMTETAALITLNHPFKISEGTIGKALPGRELSIGPDGEISVRGEMVATATWQSGGIQQRNDSWLATGDLVTADDQGNLRFLGRKSETIVNPAGLNIHPEDVEAALLEQPEISACAVVPVALPSGGEEPAAVLVAPAGPRSAKAAVIAANHSLAEFQRIRRWYLWPGPNLPRTSTGKVQRRKVAEWVAQQTASPSDIAGTPNGTGNGQAASISFVPVSSPDSGPDSNQDSNHDQLTALITSLNPTTASRTDDEARLAEDLQLDSLGRVQLQSAIEQSFGVLLDDDSYMAIETLGQLRKAIAGGAGLPTSTSPKQGQIAAEDFRQHKPAPASPPQTLSSRQPSSNFTYPRWPSWKPIAAIRILFLEAIVRPLVWLLLNPRFRTPDAAPVPSPRGDSPMLLIANHVAIFDVPLILYALPGHIRRHVAVAAAGEMLEDWKHARNQGSWWQNAFAPIMYLLLTALFHVFPLPRQAGFRRSFTHIGELLDRGYHVLIFPEGRRSLDGTLQPFRSGIGLLAQESSAPVLPVALKGMPELIARQRRWFHAGLVEIRTGSPIPIPAASSADEIAHSLHDNLAKLVL